MKNVKKHVLTMQELLVEKKVLTPSAFAKGLSVMGRPNGKEVTVSIKTMDEDLKPLMHEINEFVHYATFPVNKFNDIKVTVITSDEQVDELLSFLSKYNELTIDGVFDMHDA